MSARRWLWTALVLCGSARRLAADAPASASRIFYVEADSATASDDNPGSGERPFHTLTRAAREVRAGDTVRIGPGVYREAVRLAASGSAGRPIVFEARVPGTVIVTGLDVLGGWSREAGAAPVYGVPWTFDFVIQTRADGTRVRQHLAPAPVGCAEMVLVDDKPLSQVMSRSDLAPGRFFIDREAHRLYVQLGDGSDPSRRRVEAATRSELLGAAPGVGELTHVVLRDLTFDGAANFAQRGMVRAGTGWVIERCRFRRSSGLGVAIAGDDVLLDHVVSEDNGQAGLGGQGSRIVLRDCVLRRNNWKGFPPSVEAGGGKLAQTRGLRVEHLESYANVGPGLWLDWENHDFEIVDSRIHDNRGLKAKWEGAGLMLEVNTGPGRVLRNRVWGNDGGGIVVAESENLVVEGNVLENNNWDVELRAMPDRGRNRLAHVSVRGNVFRGWKRAAIVAGHGRWDKPEDRDLQLDEDTFEGAGPIVEWGRRSFETLADVVRALGIERRGVARPVLSLEPAE